MRVWLYDSALDRAVAAELLPMTEAHVQAANATWVPEVRRRQQVRERDEDFLVWDWPSKYNYLRSGDDRHGFVASGGGAVQGIVILQSSPAVSRLASPEQLTYVCYVATAPWNRPCRGRPGRYRRAGTLLLARAVEESMAAGCQGRTGLHSLRGADAFYRRLGFQDLGPDPAHRGMTYFELAAREGMELLSATRRWTASDEAHHRYATVGGQA